MGVRPGTSARSSALSHWASLLACLFVLGTALFIDLTLTKQARLEFSQSLSPRDTPVSLPSTGIAIVCHCTQPPPHHVHPEDWTHVLIFARQILYRLCCFPTPSHASVFMGMDFKTSWDHKVHTCFCFVRSGAVSMHGTVSSMLCTRWIYCPEFCDSWLTKTFKRFFIWRQNSMEMGNGSSARNISKLGSYFFYTQPSQIWIFFFHIWCK